MQPGMGGEGWERVEICTMVTGRLQASGTSFEGTANGTSAMAKGRMQKTVSLRDAERVIASGWKPTPARHSKGGCKRLQVHTCTMQKG
jgi:hypothetical protein